MRGREGIIELDCVRLPLTLGKTAIVDLDDRDLASCTWTARHKGKYAGRNTATGHVYLHAEIARRMGLSAQHIDHIDGDGLNNRRSNLRAATPSQNSWNKRSNRANSSGYHGVHFHAQSGKWRAQIKVANSPTISLGLFASPQLASEARDLAAKGLHGAFFRSK